MKHSRIPKKWISPSLAALKYVGIAFCAVVGTLTCVRIVQEKTGPELKLWHTTDLVNEFRADRTDVPDLDAYLKLEDALFAELDEKVTTRLPAEDRTALNRFNIDSPSSPERQGRNWNRSFVSIPPHPRGAAVLIHGLSDSPYSMHSLAESFKKRGYAVFVPRMPGHGTIPAGLREALWPDWVAATRLFCAAARKAAGPGKPLVVGGYSNGGLLAVKYALDELDKGKDGAPPEKLALFAPAVGITEFAVFAGLYKGLAAIPYFKKVNWLSIQPEYDPFKYNSFAKQAGDQIFKLSKMVERQLDALAARDGFSAFPPTLTFTSVVDSTVLTPELVSRLYSKMKPNGSELVLYDFNRSDAIADFIKDKRDLFLSSLIAAPALPFALTVITNRSSDSLAVVARRRAAQAAAWTEEDPRLKWPMGVYSLSHLAIPNSPRDPLYGNRPDLRAKGRLVLGLLQPRGETKVLDIPAAQMLRLRFNPFYSQLKRRLEQFID